MLATLSLVLPLFLLMGVGLLAIRSGAVGPDTDKGLADFVFVLAIPVLLFRAIVVAPAPEAGLVAYLAAAFTGVFAIWGATAFLVMRVFGRGAAEATVYGFAAAQANGVFIGMPLVLRAYGEAANAPLVAFVALHVPVMMIVGAVLLERSGKGGNFGALIRSLAVHPLILSTGLGIAWRLTGQPIPAVMVPVVDGLSAAALPAALVSVGMALSRYGIGSDLKLASAITVAKLIVQPLLVLVLARHVFQLPPVWVGTAVLIACCPSGINAYLFGVRYGAGEAVTASAITLSTALSIVTMTLWLLVLGAG